MSSLTERVTRGVQADAERAVEQREGSAIVRALTAELTTAKERLDLYEVLMAEKLEPPEWQLWPASGKAHHATVVAHLTDTHFDEIIKPDQLQYLNAYDRKIALRRLEHWAQSVVEIPTRYMQGVTLDGLYIPATGDLFSGEIHAELAESNEATLIESFVYWIDPLIGALEFLAREFKGHVTVDALVGNHGRNRLKPVFKNRAQNNYEWALWHVIRMRLADRGWPGEINVAPGMAMTRSLYGRNYRLEHGDTMHGGSGISAEMSPLLLGQHRRAVQQLSVGQPIEAILLGHFHRVLMLPGLIVGGSLKGYDEFAAGLALGFQEAQLLLWLTTPEYAKTQDAPIFVQNRTKEGW